MGGLQPAEVPTTSNRPLPEGRQRSETSTSNSNNNSLSLSDSVGMTSANNRIDVAKVKNLMGQTGYLELNEAEGPTGYYGERLKQSVQNYQKDNGLRVDGTINPRGETIRNLSDTLSQINQTGLINAIADERHKSQKPKITIADEKHYKIKPTPMTSKNPEKSWWQSGNLPAASDADISDNARAVSTLRKYSNNGEHSKWIAEDIKGGDKSSIAKLGDLLQQYEKVDPERAKTYNDEVMKRLPDVTKKVFREFSLSAPSSQPKVESRKLLTVADFELPTQTPMAAGMIKTEDQTGLASEAQNNQAQESGEQKNTTGDLCISLRLLDIFLLYCPHEKIISNTA